MMPVRWIVICFRLHARIRTALFDFPTAPVLAILSPPPLRCGSSGSSSRRHPLSTASRETIESTQPTAAQSCLVLVPSPLTALQCIVLDRSPQIEYNSCCVSDRIDAADGSTITVSSPMSRPLAFAGRIDAADGSTVMSRPHPLTFASTTMY